MYYKYIHNDTNCKILSFLFFWIENILPLPITFTFYLSPSMYTPPTHILDRYADVLINFALGGGAGIKAGDVVLLCVPECARPMLQPLHDAVLRSGGHPVVDIVPD